MYYIICKYDRLTDYIIVYSIYNIQNPIEIEWFFTIIGGTAAGGCLIYILNEKYFLNYMKLKVLVECWY